MQSLIMTKQEAILDFFHGLQGTVHVTLEEGNYWAWLYPLRTRVVVCNSRKNALLRSGDKSDRNRRCEAGRTTSDWPCQVCTTPTTAC
jgi:hypothetical protein